MQPTKTRYLITETAISIAINVLLSEAFAWLVFHRAHAIAAPAIVRDAIPQTFIVAFMGSLVPSLIARSRLRSGLVAQFPSRIPFIRNPFVRAVILALIATVIGVTVSAILIPVVWPQGMNFGTTLWMKGIYGALVAALITPLAVSSALSEATP